MIVAPRHRESEVQPSKSALGFIVNPIAGIGGRVGLKGSDGPLLMKAKELGATPTSPEKSIEALRRLVDISGSFDLITYPAEMGEDEAKAAGFTPRVIGSIIKGKTSSEDTKRAAREMLGLAVDMILFAGGDGTARDLCDVLGLQLPVIGIPAGVKLHSSVFGVNPRSAGDLAGNFLRGEPMQLRALEVMDIDETAFREGRVSSKLYGYMNVPFDRMLVQSAKGSSPTTEDSSLLDIAAEIVENMKPGCLYIVGPGTTTKPIMDNLGLKKTLLGIDVVLNRELVASDANETKLLELLDARDAKIIVTVIGGQGFVFGRGNQQISPKIIRRVGKENIVIVATPNKLASLEGADLLVDTDDPELDAELGGYTRVVTGYGRSVVYRISNPSE